jgi:hypothetical protein
MCGDFGLFFESMLLGLVASVTQVQMCILLLVLCSRKTVACERNKRTRRASAAPEDNIVTTHLDLQNMTFLGFLDCRIVELHTK